MTENNERLYGRTNTLKLFLMIALPGAIGMLASSLYGLFDGIFVGQQLGKTAFAAVNLAFPFVVINFSLADLIGVGSSVHIAIALGKGDKRKADNYFTCACIAIVALGTLMGAIMWPAAPHLMRLLGAEGALAEFATQYMRVYAMFSPLCTMVFAADNYLRICGKIKTSMTLNIAMSAGTVLLELLFLYAFLWGIWASAFATCMAMLAVTLVAMLPFFGGRRALKFRKPEFSIKMFAEIAGAGAPNFLNNVAGRLTSIVLNAVLIAMGGEDALAVYGVIMYVNDIVQPLMYGVCDSLQPAIGYNYGSNRPDRVKKLTKYIFIAAGIISLAAAAITFALPEQITALFLSKHTPALEEMCIFAMRLFSLTFITRWFGFAAQSFLTAINRSFYASALSISNAILLPMLFLGILWQANLTGIWLNFALTAAAVAIAAGAILFALRKSLLPKGDEGGGKNTDRAEDASE